MLTFAPTKSLAHRDHKHTVQSHKLDRDTYKHHTVIVIDLKKIQHSDTHITQAVSVRSRYKTSHATTQTLD